MNWMPVLPDELFSHRAPRAPSARAPARGCTFFSCLLPCSRPWHHPPASPVSREGWSWGGCPAFWGFFGAALLSGPSSCSTVGVGRERVADVCSVLLLPSLAPGWGRGRGLSWATPAVALWGQGLDLHLPGHVGHYVLPVPRQGPVARQGLVNTNTDQLPAPPG